MKLFMLLLLVTFSSASFAMKLECFGKETRFFFSSNATATKAELLGCNNEVHICGDTLTLKLKTDRRVVSVLTYKGVNSQNTPVTFDIYSTVSARGGQKYSAIIYIGEPSDPSTIAERMPCKKL